MHTRWLHKRYFGGDIAPLCFFERICHMKKINGFSITKLTLKGFKCFEDIAVFYFGDSTLVTASNGQGKSSIADAIAFAFVGTPFFGEKSLDRLQNKNTQEMMVSVDFVDDAGKDHNLTRSRKRDATSISYDGINVRQTDLNEAFGGRDIFLSILNPLYFINVLGDNGKGLLEKLLPVVSHEEVMAALSAYSQDVLSGQSLLSPETFIKNRRAELKELEESLISYQGQKELLEYQREERAAKLKELRTAADGIAAEMDELISIRDNGRDIPAEETALAELRKMRTELLADITNGGSEKEVQKVTKEIKTLEKSIAKLSAKDYISSHTSQIAEKETQLKNLHTEYNRLTAALRNTVAGYKCPVCASVVTEENVAAVRADLQQRISDTINDGKVVRNALEELQVQDNIDRDVFEQEQAMAVEKANQRLAGLNQQLLEMNVAHELEKEDYGARLSELESRISVQEERTANGNWSQEQALQYVELSERKKECEIQIDALNHTEDYNYANLIEDTEAQITQMKRLISETIQYMAKRIELMLDGLKMGSTEIVLTDIVKSTGEIKDCFRFSYEGRDYKCLSLSEKVRAGLDVATLIQRLSGRNYPIFVDNGESICTFGKAKPSSQVMVARVANGQELQVTYRNRMGQRKAA